MPIYEYQCDACGNRFEQIQRFSDAPVEVCTQCGKGPVRRLLSSPAIQFKGSGWYITDYARKSESGGAETGHKTEAASPTSAVAKSDAPERPPATKAAAGESTPAPTKAKE
jgi:putative FmdB family regulatory protein